MPPPSSNRELVPVASSPSPLFSGQQLPIIGISGKRSSSKSDLSASVTGQEDSKRRKLDRPVSPHLQSQEEIYEGDPALRIAYLEGVTARRLSEIKERERELEKLRTEYESNIAKIEELKEA